MRRAGPGPKGGPVMIAALLFATLGLFAILTSLTLTGEMR